MIMDLCTMSPCTLFKFSLVAVLVVYCLMPEPMRNSVKKNYKRFFMLFLVTYLLLGDEITMWCQGKSIQDVLCLSTKSNEKE